MNKSRASKISSAKLKKALRETFRLREFRPGQEDVIRSILEKRDTVAIFPTGAGKSLCYQLPALLTPGTAIVVSPLISLMKDQKDKLDSISVTSVVLNSSIAASEQKESLISVQRGKTEFVYVTPERLQTPDFVESLGKTKIDLLVIDEAHCITQWGHDFRPAYLGIGGVREKLGCPPILALTATATQEVIDDISLQLKMNDPRIVSTSVMRKNLSYSAFVTESDEEKRLRLIEELRANADSGGIIIYSSTVKGVEEIADYLTEKGVNSVMYHGRLPSKQKNENQDLFINGQVDVMVATTAFGMGIDKPDVRKVIHYNFPGSLEMYYQESGRAGRDQKPSNCVLFYLRKDKSLQSLFKGGKFPNELQIRKFCEFIDLTTPLEADQIAHVLKLPKTKTRTLIQALADSELLAADQRLGRTLDAQDVENLIQMFRKMKDADDEKLRQMVIYSQSALCRWKIILKYFGEEPNFEKCGHCDNCQPPIAS